MSAAILKFTGNWEGRFEPSLCTMEAQANAIHDARQIIAAKNAANNWTSVVLVALLASMDEDQKVRLELAIAAHAECDEAARQALAMVRLANCGKEHRARVLAAVDVLQEGEA